MILIRGTHDTNAIRWGRILLYHVCANFVLPWLCPFSALHTPDHVGMLCTLPSSPLLTPEECKNSPFRGLFWSNLFHK